MFQRILSKINRDSFKTVVLILSGVFGFVGVFQLGLLNIDWYSDRYIHTFLDVVATTSVWIVGIMFLYYFRATQKRIYLYFSAAILD